MASDESSIATEPLDHAIEFAEIAIPLLSLGWKAPEIGWKIIEDSLNSTLYKITGAGVSGSRIPFELIS